MTHPEVLAEIEAHVLQLFKKHDNAQLVYHNINHTKEVVKRSRELSGRSQIQEDEKFVLLSAAWFHDVGLLFSTAENTIEKSIEMMKSFFSQFRDYGPELISKIEGLIKSTTYQREPENVLEEILHDADTYYLGTDDFKKLNKKLKKEAQLTGKNTAINWKQHTLEYLQQHTYYTQYCKNLLEAKKLGHISAKLQNANVDGLPTLLEDDKKQQAAKIKGIQTMMRVINDNHIEFSNIADNKANLLISVNAIMISVILSVLVRRLEIDTHLTIPTIIFLLISVATIVLAILSTKPKVTSGVFKREDVLSRKINLMFFGNFHKTEVNDFAWGMRELMNDPDYLYGTMAKDVHQLGVVLARKYKLISAAYLVFMYGIIVTVVAFVIAMIFGQPVMTTPMPI